MLCPITDVLQIRVRDVITWDDASFEVTSGGDGPECVCDAREVLVVDASMMIKGDRHARFSRCERLVACLTPPARVFLGSALSSYNISRSASLRPDRRAFGLGDYYSFAGLWKRR